VIPAAFADSWIDLVFAVRQPLSAPTWAKPRVILPDLPPPDPEAVPLLPPPQAVNTLRAANPAATTTADLRTADLLDMLCSLVEAAYVWLPDRVMQLTSE
jgi:hypothetical protein